MIYASLIAWTPDLLGFRFFVCFPFLVFFVNFFVCFCVVN